MGLTRWRVAGMHAESARRVLQSVLGGDAEVQVTSDLEGVQEVLAGRADVYVGICATGSGGALAMAQVFAGTERCRHIEGNTSVSALEESLSAGVICFGIAADALGSMLPTLAAAVRHHHTVGTNGNTGEETRR